VRGQHFLIVLWMLAAVSSVDAQVDDEPLREVRPGVYVGISSCANGFCHGAVEPLAETAVLQNEYPTWMLDPHRRAYERLAGPEFQAVAEALEPGKKATEVKLCLGCHALDVPPQLSDGLYIEDGISCEGCHGPAGGWRDRHFEEGWTHAQSVRAGMKDLRDPARRGEVCLACHLGAEGRAVDHRLIAAGHPRLFFELDNAAGALPRHWKLDAERPDRPASHGVRAWAVGQAVAFREGLEQLARHAESGTWPEFAEYNCQSCHHSLADAAWRRQPGYRHQGGLPRWSAARAAVLRHLAGEREDLDRAMDGLGRLMASMGPREQVAVKARELAGRLDAVAGELAKKRWTKDEVRDTMRRLAADREPFLTDVAAAEQLAFALQSLMSRRVELDRRQLRSTAVAAIDGLFSELDDPHAFDRERFDRRLGELEEAVNQTKE